MSFEIEEVENNVTKNGATFMNGLQQRIKNSFDEVGGNIQDITEDTGWVDLSSYLANSDYLTIRPNDGNKDFKPMARRIGNLIYFRGEIYCSTNFTAKQIDLLTSIPSEFRPAEQFSTSGCRYQTSSPYNIFLSKAGQVQVSQGSNITTQESYQGFQLTVLTGILAG